MNVSVAASVAGVFILVVYCFSCSKKFSIHVSDNVSMTKFTDLHNFKAESREL